MERCRQREALNSKLVELRRLGYSAEKSGVFCYCVPDIGSRWYELGNRDFPPIFRCGRERTRESVQKSLKALNTYVIISSVQSVIGFCNIECVENSVL